jgi:hypothetical protein
MPMRLDLMRPEVVTHFLMSSLALRTVAAFALVLPSLPASADLRVELLEGGGNAAAYGQMTVYSDTQGAVAKVPPNAFSGDNCADRPNSGWGTLVNTHNLSDTPLGTVLHARVQRSQPYTDHCGVCGEGVCSVFPACTVKFLGWSGECTGLGESVPNFPLYSECTFTWDGDGYLGATFQFESNNLGDTGECVRIDVPTTTTLSGPPTTTTLFMRNPLLDALDDLVDQLLPPIVIKGIAGLGLDLVAVGNGAPRGRYRGQLSTGASRGATPTAAGTIIIAKGGARVGKKGQLSLKLKPTRRARKLRQSPAALALDLEVSARAGGETFMSSRSVTVGP